MVIKIQRLEGGSTLRPFVVPDTRLSIARNRGSGSFLLKMG